MQSSAAAAERVAIAIASNLVPNGAQIAIVSDCASAVQEVNSLAVSSRVVAPWGGLWRQVDSATLLSATHV
jgi:hypothetical protein